MLGNTVPRLSFGLRAWRNLLVSAVLLLVTGIAVSLAPVMPVVAAQGTAVVHEGPRQVTFVNGMQETIWVAASPGNAPAQLRTTGWALSPASLSLLPSPTIGTVASGAGRAATSTPRAWAVPNWGLRQQVQCPGFGAIPATLAEYDLDAWDHLDFYDVSMVDGSNLPMYINQFGGSGKDRSASTDVRGPVAPKPWFARPCSRSTRRQGRRLHFCVRSLRDRPVLLPRQVVEPIGL